MEYWFSIDSDLVSYVFFSFLFFFFLFLVFLDHTDTDRKNKMDTNTEKLTKKNENNRVI